LDIEFKDVFAAGLTAATLFLIYCGKDGTVTSVLLAVVAFYFGSKSKTANGIVARINGRLNSK
jgi:hypothetical protein